MSNMERIDLGEFDERYAGGFVDVKVKRPFSVHRKIEGAMLRVSPKPGVSLDELRSEDVDLVMSPLDRSLAVLQWHVVAWSLQDDAGEALPVGRAGVLHEDFDADLGDWIEERIEQLVESRRRSVEERKTLAGPSTESSSEDAAQDTPAN